MTPPSQELLQDRTAGFRTLMAHFENYQQKPRPWQSNRAQCWPTDRCGKAPDNAATALPRSLAAAVDGLHLIGREG